MMELAIVVRQSTLTVLAEHSVTDVGGAVPINDSEALVLFTADTLRRLLDRARPQDTRIDDVIVRLAV